MACTFAESKEDNNFKKKILTNSHELLSSVFAQCSQKFCVWLMLCFLYVVGSMLLDVLFRFNFYNNILIEAILLNACFITDLWSTFF